MKAASTLATTHTHTHTHTHVQNIKERHVNNGIPNLNNQMDTEDKGGRRSANQIVAERHQDMGESPHDDDKEKANDIEQQRNAEVVFDNFDDFGDLHDQIKQEGYQEVAQDGGLGKHIRSY